MYISFYSCIKLEGSGCNFTRKNWVGAQTFFLNTKVSNMYIEAQMKK